VACASCMHMLRLVHMHVPVAFLTRFPPINAYLASTEIHAKDPHSELYMKCREYLSLGTSQFL
jgi:hypothetical protein